LLKGRGWAKIPRVRSRREEIELLTIKEEKKCEPSSIWSFLSLTSKKEAPGQLCKGNLLRRWGRGIYGEKGGEGICHFSVGASDWNMEYHKFHFREKGKDLFPTRGTLRNEEKGAGGSGCLLEKKKELSIRKREGKGTSTITLGRTLRGRGVECLWPKRKGHRIQERKRATSWGGEIITQKFTNTMERIG